MVIMRFARGCAPALFVFMALLLAGIASAVAATHTGTIVLKNGERYENVKYKSDRALKVIQFVYQDEHHAVSFLDVDNVLTRGGRDVTSNALPGFAERRHPEETWQSEDSPEIKKARIPGWSARFHGYGSYSVLAGDYYEGLNGDIGFGTHIAVSITGNAAIRTIFGYSGIKTEEAVRFVSFDPQYRVVDQDVSFNALRFYLAAEYYKYLDWRERTSMFYVYFGLGTVRTHGSAEVTLREVSTGAEIVDKSSSTEGKFSLCWGFGLSKLVSSRVALEGGAHMDMIAFSASSGGYGSRTVYSYIFVFRLGLTVVV